MLKKDDRGYIVVETLGAFLPFVLLLLFIVMLVNVAALQAKVHFALTQTAKEISIQSYMGGAAESERERTVSALQNFIRYMNSVLPVDEMPPEELSAIFRSTDNWQMDEIIVVFERYMWRGDETIETQGLIGGIDAFDFSKSKVDFENGIVELVVEYSVDYTFMGILQPPSALKVKQSAVTKMWRNGNGRGYDYWKDGSNNIDTSRSIGGGGRGGDDGGGR